MQRTSRRASSEDTAGRSQGRERSPTRRNGKQAKQQRRAQEILRQTLSDLSDKIGKLEDRDTQQQAFAALIEMLPTLDTSLINELYVRIEKNKHPPRSSTRRMLVLLVAALCRDQSPSMVRLLPRVLAYVSLRLRDTESQITDACVILCSAIALHVLPFTRVNRSGLLSPSKTMNPLPPLDRPTNDGTSEDTVIVADPQEQSWKPHFESLLTALQRDSNAVGEHVAHCICGVINPVEFDGISSPPSAVMLEHGRRIREYLSTLIAGTVAHMRESSQYSGFAASFLVLRAGVQLARHVQRECDQPELLRQCVFPHVRDVIDVIDDAFREAPRSDWVLRKRGIELLFLFLELGVAMSDFISDEAHEGERTFLQSLLDNMQPVRAIVQSARHDPVCAVRDAAQPALQLVDTLLKRLPGQNDSAKKDATAPRSPFRSVYSAKGIAGAGGGCYAKPPFSVDNRPTGQGMQRGSKKLLFVELGGDSKDGEDQRGEKEEESSNLAAEFGSTSGDEAIVAPECQEDDSTNEKLPSFELPNIRNYVEDTDGDPANTEAIKPESKARRPRRSVSHLVPARKRSTKTTSSSLCFPFAPLMEDNRNDTNAVEQRSRAPSLSVMFPTDSDGDEASLPPAMQDAQADADHKSTKSIDCDNDSDTEDTPVTRADAAFEAMEQGELDMALRLCCIEDDNNLLMRVLARIGAPCMLHLNKSTRTALCAAFLETLDLDQPEQVTDRAYDDYVWVVLTWLRDLSRHRNLVDELDPRVLYALDDRLNAWSVNPSKLGLLAADILTRFGL